MSTEMFSARFARAAELSERENRIVVLLATEAEIRQAEDDASGAGLESDASEIEDEDGMRWPCLVLRGPALADGDCGWIVRMTVRSAPESARWVTLSSGERFRERL